MAEKPGTDIVTSTNTLPALDSLDAAGFSALVRARQREAFAVLGMSEEVFQALIGSRSPEDRAAQAGRMRKMTEYYLRLAQTMEQGTLEIPVPEEPPWNGHFKALPNGPLKDALKEQFLVWIQSGMDLEMYMDHHPHFQTLWKHRSEPTV